jgi:hypothetical protein
MPLTKLCRRILLGLVTRWRRPCQRELATQLASVPRTPSLSLSNASVEHYTQKRSLTSLEHSHIHIAYYSFGLGWVSDAMLPAPAFSALCIASISAHNCRWFARTVRPQTTTATTKQKRKQPVKPERLETAHAQGERNIDLSQGLYATHCCAVARGQILPSLPESLGQCCSRAPNTMRSLPNARKRLVLLIFRYVCPEPVLTNVRVLV